MKHFLLVSFFVCSVQCYAQVITASITESTNVLSNTAGKGPQKGKAVFADDKNSFIEVEPGKVGVKLGYTVRLNDLKHAFTIRKFDSNRKEIGVNKLENAEKAFGPLPTVSLEINKHLLLIYTRYEEKDSFRIFVSEVDKNSLALKNTVNVYSSAQKNIGAIGLFSFTEDLLTVISPDSTKLLIAYNNKNGELFSCVVNEKAEVLRKTVSRNIVPKDAKITDAYLENSGHAALVASIPNELVSTSKVLGVIVQRLDNKERFLSYEVLGNGSNPHHLHFKSSKDNTKLYIFGNYAEHGYSMGVWLAELKIADFKLSAPAIFPYTEEFTKQAYETGFGDRKKGNYSVVGVDYNLIEFENGDLALCGYPEIITQGQKYQTSLAGPVIMAFIEKKQKQVTFSMIPRNQHNGGGSDAIYIPYHEKLIVVYNDYAKRFEGEVSPKDVDRIRINMVKELSLGYAIVKKDGTIQEKKILIDGSARMDFFVTNQHVQLSDASLLIPYSDEIKQSDVRNVVIIKVK